MRVVIEGDRRLGIKNRGDHLGGRKGSPGDLDQESLAGIARALKDRKRKVHFLGVGNPIRSDDAVGLETVSSLRRRFGKAVPSGVVVHRQELSPERLLSRLASTGDMVFVFDAVEALETPGAIVFASLGDTRYGFFATHNIPLRLIPGLSGEDHAFYLVGVQPASLEVGEGLSPAVARSVEKLVAAIAGALEGVG